MKLIAVDSAADCWFACSFDETLPCLIFRFFRCLLVAGRVNVKLQTSAKTVRKWWIWLPHILKVCMWKAKLDDLNHPIHNHVVNRGNRTKIAMLPVSSNSTESERVPRQFRAAISLAFSLLFFWLWTTPTVLPHRAFQMLPGTEKSMYYEAKTKWSSNPKHRHTLHQVTVISLVPKLPSPHLSTCSGHQATLLPFGTSTAVELAFPIIDAKHWQKDAIPQEQQLKTKPFLYVREGTARPIVSALVHQFAMQNICSSLTQAPLRFVWQRYFSLSLMSIFQAEVWAADCGSH